LKPPKSPEGGLVNFVIIELLLFIDVLNLIILVFIKTPLPTAYCQLPTAKPFANCTLPIAN
jgi:hypothetical protein